jgi:hypothetical protein
MQAFVICLHFAPFKWRSFYEGWLWGHEVLVQATTSQELST